MKVGFINTSGKQNEKPFRIVPLGSLYLLTILEEEFGDSLELSYTDLRGIGEDAIRYHIPELDVYLYYVTTPEFPEIQCINASIRWLYPEAIHLAGGPHVNIFPEDSLKVFDSICIGEGEEVIKQMIRDISNNNLQKIYRQSGEIDLNIYPFPLRKYLPKSAIVDVGLLSRKYNDLLGTSVLFSRGCPFNCHFCSNQYKGITRVRSPEWIIREINYLKDEYNIKSLLLKDDQGINANKNIAHRTLKAIGETDIIWRGQSRANGIDRDTIKLAKKSGCVEIAVAIESVSQHALDIMNKKIDLNKALEYFKILRDEEIDIKLLLILGLPGEPKDIAQQTINFIKKVRPSNVSLSILCPIPGSEIWKNPNRFGMKINHNITFDKYMFAFGRFNSNEKSPAFFEYDKITPFGEGMSMDDIASNHETVQRYLRENGINF